MRLNKINLSYILSTRNKLEYLKYTLPKLIANKKADEEIIIIDGNSDDGTNEYLKSLLEESKDTIDLVISESDFGEAHALNKGLLVAKGDVIKFIADDDIFCYKAIQSAKSIMLSDESIDITFGVTYNVKFGKIESLECQNEVEVKYLKYLNDFTPFSFTGLSMMIRKTSLARTGLFSTLTIAPDTEFSLRVTSLRVNVYYTKFSTVVRVENLNSNYNMDTRHKFILEGLKLFLSFGLINVFEYQTKKVVESIRYLVRKNLIMIRTKVYNANSNGSIEHFSLHSFYDFITTFLENEFEKDCLKN